MIEEIKEFGFARTFAPVGEACHVAMGHFNICAGLAISTVWFYSATTALEDLIGNGVHWAILLSFIFQASISLVILSLLNRNGIVPFSVAHVTATTPTKFRMLELFTVSCSLVAMYFSEQRVAYPIPELTFVLTERLVMLVPLVVMFVQNFLMEWPFSVTSCFYVTLMCIGGSIAAWFGFKDDSGFTPQIWACSIATCLSVALFIAFSRYWAEMTGLTECGLLFYFYRAAIIPAILLAAFEGHFQLAITSENWGHLGFLFWFGLHICFGVVRTYVFFLCVRVNSPLAASVTKITTDALLLLGLLLPFGDDLFDTVMSENSLVRHRRLSFQGFIIGGAATVITASLLYCVALLFSLRRESQGYELLRNTT
eukprot:c23952_g1_i1.p1 GENE.c23952_g1_i1~~c23952_g1_i1.p1  ORF type:complete len:385 (-),score=56.24 c23952_g1_i1:184-1290(-)